MTNMICIKDNQGDYVYHQTSPEVALYIHQLECYIRNPKKSKLKKVYPDRFNPRKYGKKGMSYIYQREFKLRIWDS